MRPVRLVMQGFGAYRDRTEVDFEGVDLFALTGPTGAGKSTVVDAICMALYGSVPRYDNKTLIAPAISQGLNEAMVHLDFLVEAHVQSVTDAGSDLQYNTLSVSRADRGKKQNRDCGQPASRGSRTHMDRRSAGISRRASLRGMTSLPQSPPPPGRSSGTAIRKTPSVSPVARASSRHERE